MLCRFVVLAFLASFSTTGVIAITLECSNDEMNCTIFDVQTNYKNEIEWTVDKSKTQKAIKIEIKRSKFPFFPSNFFEPMTNLKTLVAVDCGIVNLKIFGLNSLLEFTEILNLDLTYNLVETLEAYTFYQTKNLRNISLYSNRLSYIDALAFYGLSHLEFLNLYNNQLANLHQSVFAPLVSVAHIHLSRNKLKVFNFDNLANNGNLKALVLWNNSLSTLQATLVNNVIDIIDLGGNQLGNISALGKMKGMHDLYLYNNKKVDLIFDDFSEMSQLSLLHIDGVDFQRRLNNNYQFLTPLQQLRDLYIGGNNLKSLNQFPSLQNLVELGVDKNEISDLDVTSLRAQFPKLINIIINDNPWKCHVLTNVYNLLLINNIKIDFRKKYPGLPAGSINVNRIACDDKVVNTKYDR
jgi:Leucine-rich repeat (LRR) protein